MNEENCHSVTPLFEWTVCWSSDQHQFFKVVTVNYAANKNCKHLSNPIPGIATTGIANYSSVKMNADFMQRMRKEHSANANQNSN